MGRFQSLLHPLFLPLWEDPPVSPRETHLCLASRPTCVLTRDTPVSSMETHLCLHSPLCGVFFPHFSELLFL